MALQGRMNDLAMADADSHGCPACPHPVIGPAIIGSPTVYVNGLPALRVSDFGTHAACCGPNMWQAGDGSSTVFYNFLPAHRMGDLTIHCGGVGRLVTGSPDVDVGP